MCLIGKYWKTVLLLLKFCFKTLKPHWNILYTMKYKTTYCIISVSDKIVHKYSSLFYIWERTVYSLFFIIFNLSEGSFWISLPVWNCPCISAQAWHCGHSWDPVLELLSRGCTLRQSPFLEDTFRVLLERELVCRCSLQALGLLPSRLHQKEKLLKEKKEVTPTQDSTVEVALSTLN